VLGIAVLGAVFSSSGGYTSGQAFVHGFTPAIEVGAAVVFLGMLTALVIPGVRRARAARAIQEGESDESPLELYLDRGPRCCPKRSAPDPRPGGTLPLLWPQPHRTGPAFRRSRRESALTVTRAPGTVNLPSE